MVSTDAGLQVFNDSNTLQIDGLFKNYEFKQKGTHTTTNVYEGLPVISYQGSDPIIALRGSGGRTPWLEYMYLENGYWNISVGAYGAGLVEWWIFDSASLVPSDTYGLEVYTPDGQLAFSALRKYMRVIALLDDASRFENPYYTGLDVDGYPKYVVPGAADKILGTVHCRWGFKPEKEAATGSGASYIPGYEGAWVTGSYSISGGVCLRDYFLNGNAYYGGTSYSEAMVMLVDVTGL